MSIASKWCAIFVIAFWNATHVVLAADTAPAESETIRFEPMVVTPFTPHPNLLVNSSFEQFGADGVPTGWKWFQCRSEARGMPDAEDPHSGKRCLKIVNGTPPNKDVYGDLCSEKPIKLKPGTHYTLGAWMKMNTPGGPTLITGADQQFGTTNCESFGDWRHVSTTFTPEPKDCDCIVRIVTTTPTPGAWIDDIKLEEGNTATPDMPSFHDRAAALALNETNCTFRDEKSGQVMILQSGPFNLSYSLNLKQAVVGTLEVAMSTGEKYQPPIKVEAGAYSIMLSGTTTATDRPRVLSMRLNSDGKELAHADTRVRFLSPEYARIRLAAYEVTALQQAKPDVLLLQSSTASIWNPSRYEGCMLQLYKSLAFTGLKIGFVTERQLEEGRIPETKVVLVPNITHLSDAAMASLHKYQGHVLLVGDKNDLLAFDEYDHPYMKRIHGETVDLAKAAAQTDPGLRAILQVKLKDWNVRPMVDIVHEDRKPVWGVEWRCAETPDGTIVNVCNYRSIPLTISLNSGGQTLPAEDVLTGQTVNGPLVLQPLDFRLLRISNTYWKTGK